MREIRQSGSEGGEAGNLTGLPYPYQGYGVNSASALSASAKRASNSAARSMSSNEIISTGLCM